MLATGQRSGVKVCDLPYFQNPLEGQQWDRVGMLDYNLAMPILAALAEADWLDDQVSTQYLSDMVSEAINRTWASELWDMMADYLEDDVPPVPDSVGQFVHYLWEELWQLVDRLEMLIEADLAYAGEVTYFIDITNRIFMYGGNYNG